MTKDSLTILTHTGPDPLGGSPPHCREPAGCHHSHWHHHKETAAVMILHLYHSPTSSSWSEQQGKGCPPMYTFACNVHTCTVHACKSYCTKEVRIHRTDKLFSNSTWITTDIQEFQVLISDWWHASIHSKLIIRINTMHIKSLVGLDWFHDHPVYEPRVQPLHRLRIFPPFLICPSLCIRICFQKITPGHLVPPPPFKIICIGRIHRWPEKFDWARIPWI